MHNTMESEVHPVANPDWHTLLPAFTTPDHPRRTHEVDKQNKMGLKTEHMEISSTQIGEEVTVVVRIREGVKVVIEGM
jgi:hypothetical protein